VVAESILPLTAGGEPTLGSPPAPSPSHSTTQYTNPAPATARTAAACAPGEARLTATGVRTSRRPPRPRSLRWARVRS